MGRQPTISYLGLRKGDLSWFIHQFLAIWKRGKYVAVHPVRWVELVHVISMALLRTSEALNVPFFGWKNSPFLLMANHLEWEAIIVSQRGGDNLIPTHHPEVPNHGRRCLQWLQSGEWWEWRIQCNCDMGLHGGFPSPQNSVNFCRVTM